MNKDIQKVELLAEIREAFGSASLGDGISLHQADAIDDYAGEEQIRNARALDVENHWWEISSVQLQQFHSAIFFMDAEGFRYYLPAYMTEALKTFPASSLSMNAVLACLFPILKEREAQFTLLDNGQRKVIAKFLWFVSTEATDQSTDQSFDKLDVYNATKALETFWYPYLS